jgi:hypothetical protein
VAPRLRVCAAISRSSGPIDLPLTQVRQFTTK